MEVFYRTHNYLIEHISDSLVRRDLMDEIDESKVGSFAEADFVKVFFKMDNSI